ncbi:MAG: energy transducer TonB [Litorimonas sp.]
MRTLIFGIILLMGMPPGMALGQVDSGYALSARIQNQILGVEVDFERMTRARAPEFILQRSVETLPLLSGKTIDVPIKLRESEQVKVSRPSSPPVIATVHDRRTGRPLDSCEAPCILKSPMIPPGMLTLYRYGTKPLSIGAEIYAFDPDPPSIFLGFNEVDHQLERDRCAMEFKVLRLGEVTRDAEACVRVPPRMPDEAQRSGYCRVTFNISQTGDPIDVRADECSEQIFCEPTTEAVRRWIYYPRLEYGEVAERMGVKSSISFRLTGIGGRVIPQGEGEMQPCVGSA